MCLCVCVCVQLYMHSLYMHLGYVGNDQTAVIVVSAYYLPPKNLRNYQQVISQTFL